MNNIILSNAEKSQLNSHLESKKFPDGYRYLKSIVDGKIGQETNTSNRDDLARLSNWLDSAASINSNDGSAVSEFVYHATSAYSTIETGNIVTRERFQEVSNLLAGDVFNQFLQDKANFAGIINKDVNRAVTDFGLPRWGWAGTLGDGLPMFALGLGQDVVQVGGASMFDYLANLAKVLLANNYAFNAAIAVSAGKFIGNLLHEFHQATSPTSLLINPTLTTDWNTAKNTISPLILDLDGDGIVETQSKTTGIHFDHAGDGFAESSGWAGSDDGLLVRDINGDGAINNGGELFGNNTRLSNGEKATNGFEALKDLDSNRDGKLNSADTAWNALRMWKDTDSDAQTDTGELLTLAQAGVQQINLAYTNNTTTDQNGNDHKQTSSYTTTAGTVRAVHDVWFSTDNWNTIDQRTPLALSSEVAALPEVMGSGNLTAAVSANMPHWRLAA